MSKIQKLRVTMYPELHFTVFIGVTYDKTKSQEALWCELFTNDVILVDETRDRVNANYRCRG